MKIEEIEADLIQLCDAAIASGWTLEVNVTCSLEYKKCCALGAAYAVHPDQHNINDVSYVMVANERYGLSEGESVALTEGFDFDESQPISTFSSHYIDFFHLGQRLRKRYIKE